MSGAFLKLYDPSVTHTRVLLVTGLVSHFVSAGMANPFHIQVPPQLWGNSINNCSSVASVPWSGAPVDFIHMAPSLDSITVADFPGGSLYRMVSCLWYFFKVRPSVSIGR